MGSDSAPLLDRVTLQAVDDLIPYQGNPKEHPDGQIDKIASSINNYGFDQPIVVDSAGEIIKGHGRFEAAKKLELDRVPVITRDDLTDAEIRAARIADNQTHMDSGWDMDSLAIELDQLRDTESIDDLADATAFDDVEIDGILDARDFDVDAFFEDTPADDEDVDDQTEGQGPPAGLVACPECGHEFEPTLDTMGE